MNVVEIEEKSKFLILACDGLWDVMSDQEAVDLIFEENDPSKAAEVLRDEAFNRKSTDNISVIVVFLKKS